MRNTGTIVGFVKKAQGVILDCPWQVIQVRELPPKICLICCLKETQSRSLKGEHHIVTGGI